MLFESLSQMRGSKFSWGCMPPDTPSRHFACCYHPATILFPLPPSQLKILYETLLTFLCLLFFSLFFNFFILMYKVKLLPEMGVQLQGILNFKLMATVLPPCTKSKVYSNQRPLAVLCTSLFSTIFMENIPHI